MDLQLYLRVVSRFRVLIIGGLVLAFVLAVFSFVRVSFSNGSPKLAYRQTQLWESDSKLFVGQKGFPWGRTTPQYVTTKAGSTPVPAADLTRLGSLAVLYAELAKGDEVQRMMGVRGPNARPIDVKTLPGPAFSTVALLPIIQISAVADTQAGAVAKARTATNGLLTYIHSQQSAAGIKQNQRVDVQVLAKPVKATLLSGRGKTLPLVVFVAVMVAVIGLAFVLENLRPRIRTVGKAEHGTTAPFPGASRRAA